MISINIIDITNAALQEKAQVVKDVIADFPAHFDITTFTIDDYLKQRDLKPDLILINYDINPLIIRQIAIDLQKRDIVTYFIFYNQNPRYIKENPTRSLIRMIETGHFQNEIRETLACFMTLYDPHQYFHFLENGISRVILIKDIKHIHLAKHSATLFTDQKTYHIDDQTQVTHGLSIDPHMFFIINKEHMIAYHAIKDVHGYELILTDGYRIKMNAGVRNKVLNKIRR